MLSPGMRQAASISNSAANQIESQFAKMQAGGKRMGASVNELHQRLEAINKVRFSTTIEKEFNIATKAAQKLEAQIEKLENKGSRSKSGGMGVGDFVKGNLISGAISKGLGMVQDFGIDSYQTSLKNSGLKTAINSTTGGQGAAAISQTDAISNKYGLNYEASLEGVKTLTGGLKSMNLPLQEQMKIFEGVSTGVAAMKLSSDDAKGAMLALGQMASKGTVSAEELRGQLGERIPGAFGIAAKAMNVTEAQLGKMMEKGEVAAKDFLPKFAAEMQKIFGADALAAANGPQAVQERFNNAIYKMKAEIGDGFMPLITPFIVKFTELATAILPYVSQGIQFISDLLGSVFMAINSISGGTGEWGSYLDVVKNFIGSVWITVKSLLGNIWSIVSGVIQWMGKSELLKDVFWAIGKIADGILWVIRGIGDAIQWIFNNIIKPILDAVDWVYSKIKGVFGSGKTQIEITDGTQAAAAGGTAPSIPGLNVYQPAIPTAATVTNPITLNTGNATTKEAPLLDKAVKSKAESINGGGQKSIIINIGKQIERLEFTVMDAKESAEKIESVVKETMRRVMYSINGVATS